MRNEYLTVKELREEGYAVVMFSPDELQGADRVKVEEGLVQAFDGIAQALEPTAEEALAMAFKDQPMKPEYRFGTYYIVETGQGDEVVPGILLGGEGLRAVDARLHLKGEPLDPAEPLKVQAGWLARLSAPDLLDCTDWTIHRSREEAMSYLIENYGE
jgi:hypothetical protein